LNFSDPTDGLVLAAPRYPETWFYAVSGNIMRPWEFSGWQTESLSWKNTAYIHGGLSGYGPMNFTGPDAEKFIASICTNSFAKFPIGAMKHAIMCTEEGLVASHGVLQRMGPEEFRLFASGIWAAYMHSKTDLDVQIEHKRDYLFQVAGPKSLEILEKVTGESLRDIQFLRFRDSRINGKSVEVARVGMAGTLAYELHGPMADAPEIYDAVYQAGKELGIERLGWRTYFVNHIEGGFPQQVWTFVSAQVADPDFLRYFENTKVALNPKLMVSGSVDPSDMRARFRTPFEVNWDISVKFNHDFVGRAALEPEAADIKRRTVTLRWHPDDILDIYASLLRPGDPYKQLELPASPHIRGQHAHADHVLKDGKRVGIASGTVYSFYYREVISHCAIDVDQAEIGNEVVVEWGDYGGRIKQVRAVVERFPYLDIGRNSDVDVSATR